MSSGFQYKDKSYNCSNGIAELFLIHIIKHAHDKSRLYYWSIESYRAHFPGMEYNLDDVIIDKSDVNEWKQVITLSVTDILSSGVVSIEFSNRLKQDKSLLIDLRD